MQSCWRKLRKPLIFIVLIESVAIFEFAGLCEVGCAVNATRRCCAGAGGHRRRQLAGAARIQLRGNLPALLSCVRVERSFFLWTGMPHE